MSFPRSTMSPKVTGHLQRCTCVHPGKSLRLGYESVGLGMAMAAATFRCRFAPGRRLRDLRGTSALRYDQLPARARDRHLGAAKISEDFGKQFFAEFLGHGQGAEGILPDSQSRRGPRSRRRAEIVTSFALAVVLCLNDSSF
jgi:hypothetical protein